jgi:IS1 family transposase
MYYWLMNKLSTAKRIQIVTALVEGMGIRATARLCDVTKGAISKLLADVGTIAAEYHNIAVRNVEAKRVQADEIWSFCYAKVRTVRKDQSILERNANAGDCWTWTAIDADSKLMISYLVGSRTADNAYALLSDLKSRVTDRIQLTTDQLTVYMKSADRVFGINVDYAMLHKIYAQTGDSGRYSPPECIGTRSVVMTGSPDPKHISTFYVERSNLTMRMHMRRFTRLTNGHSKKLEMHQHAVALHFLYYNFCKIHESLRVTPAMAANIADSPWTVADIIGLLERVERAA